MKKMTCIKSIVVMGRVIYQEGVVYDFMEYIENDELKGYKVESNWGVGIFGMDDESLVNFEEYKETYEIKAIRNTEILLGHVPVFYFDGEVFVYHDADGYTNVSYQLEEVINNKEWTIFEFHKDEVKRIKNKNIKKALMTYNEFNGGND